MGEIMKNIQLNAIETLLDYKNSLKLLGLNTEMIDKKISKILKRMKRG